MLFRLKNYLYLIFGIAYSTESIRVKKGWLSEASYNSVPLQLRFEICKELYQQKEDPICGLCKVYAITGDLDDKIPQNNDIIICVCFHKNSYDPNQYYEYYFIQVRIVKYCDKYFIAITRDFNNADADAIKNSIDNISEICSNYRKDSLFEEVANICSNYDKKHSLFDAVANELIEVALKKVSEILCANTDCLPIERLQQRLLFKTECIPYIAIAYGVIIAIYGDQALKCTVSSSYEEYIAFLEYVKNPEPYDYIDDLLVSACSFVVKKDNAD